MAGASTDDVAAAEQALLNDPIPIYEQNMDGEKRCVYYGATDKDRLLALVAEEGLSFEANSRRVIND